MEIPQLLQRRIIFGALRRGATKDDVIQHINLEQMPGANQVARHFYVRIARRGIAAGMIVREHDG